MGYFKLVVDEANPICSEVVLDRDEIVYVHPNKERAEEYSHLPLEQCKCVYDDLVNQNKSLAKNIQLHSDKYLNCKPKKVTF